jgi:hypothetical protein
MHGPVSGTPHANNVKDMGMTDSNWLSAFTVLSLDTIAAACLKVLISNQMQITKWTSVSVSNVVITCSIVPLGTVQSVVPCYGI